MRQVWGLQDYEAVSGLGHLKKYFLCPLAEVSDLDKYLEKSQSLLREKRERNGLPVLSRGILEEFALNTLRQCQNNCEAALEAVAVIDPEHLLHPGQFKKFRAKCQRLRSET